MAGVATNDDEPEHGDGADRLIRRLQLAGAELVASGGAGRYVIVDGGDGSEAWWGRLRRWCSDNRARTAFADYVMPQCPLLSAERARAVQLPIGLQAPAGSAWVAMRLDVSRFVSTATASVAKPALERSLRTCVDVGERLHDVLRWPSEDMRRDSRLNRRLAVVIDGIGDAAARLELDPCALETLRRLGQLVLGIRTTLQVRSRELAECSEQLPAIALSDPSHALPCGGVRDDWQRRWRSAVSASLVRHRNLLVMSPWALFPSRYEADFRYAELLPLLRHADACAFAGKVSTAHWNLNEFRRFHERARAVLQQRGTGSLFAEQL